MIIALVLLTYAVVGATAGAALLGRATWPSRAPRLAIVAWQAAGVSVLLAVVMAGGALAVRIHPVSGGVAELLHLCVTNLQSAYAAPGRSVTTTLGLLTVIVVSARSVWGVAGALRSARRARRRQGALIDLLGRRDADLGLTVIEHPAAAAFCLPGRPDRVVVTSRAMATLTAAELGAVLAHERAHLCGRHHLLVSAAHGLRRAFPWVPVFHSGAEHIGQLVEMATDDVACRDRPRSVVASALMLLAAGGPPAAALALGGHTAELRMFRLAGHPRRLPRSACVAAGLLIIAALLLPVALAAVPALVVAGLQYCGLG
ncbi:MAG: M56 family metallopeptidase [Catenulispora sp.]|nr:M56 family metallopeptidase [Catenulispora sp.]